MDVIENIYLRFKEAGQNICTDTRKITPGCIFFGLRGENFNGNAFAKDALTNGAAYAVVDDPSLEKNSRFIFTENVLTDLQQLATFHRRQLKTKIIALTGSNGKTTTKELINSVLSLQFKTYSTQGNLNNHIGVPVTLLALKADHEFAVVEMGANHQKEIELLCSIAQPGFGLITNVGKAHLEGFGGFEGVKKGKKELYDFLKENGGTIFLNAGNPQLTEMCGAYDKIFSYGENEKADIVGSIISSASFLKISWHVKNNPAEKNNIQSNLTGNYNLENILAAISIGKFFGVENNTIQKGIENYFPSNQRSQVVEKNSNTFILDYYNANPTSMEAALLNFEKNYSGKKVAILGDMLELGDETEKEHLNIIHLLKKLNFSEIILVGECFLKFSFRLFRMKAHFFQTSEEAKAYLQKQNFSDSNFLIKGSRGVMLEKVAGVFEL